MESRFLIYALIDPNTKEIRYIGRSVSGLKRPREHMCPKHLKLHKSHCVSWIKSLNGIRPKIMILEYSSSSKELDLLEQDWICYFRFLGARLTNHTLGGGGTRNYKHDEVAIKKISEASKNRWSTGNRIIYTEEVRFKCGSSTRGKKFSEEKRQKWAKVKGTKPFLVFDKTGKIIGIFYSKNECSKVIKIDRKTISKGLKKELDSDYVYRFEELPWVS